MPPTVRFQKYRVGSCQQAQKHIMQKTTPGWGKLEAAMWAFLSMELDVGLMFARAATGTADVGEVLRNRRLARKAYDTFDRMIERIPGKSTDGDGLKVRQATLLQALRDLGEPDLPPN
jgi:hypothetical protein